MNEGLFTAYAALSEWKELLEKLKTESCVALGGMTEGEKPFFAAALAHRTGRPCCFYPRRSWLPRSRRRT
jgi:hypothetical protein